MEAAEISFEKYQSEKAALCQGTLLKNLVATEALRIGQELGNAQPSSASRANRRAGIRIQEEDPQLTELRQAQAEYERVASSQEGVCAALSHKWIKMKLKDRLGKKGKLEGVAKKDYTETTPAGRIAALQRTPTLKRAVERQIAYQDDKNRFKGFDSLADKYDLTGYIQGKRTLNNPQTIAAAVTLIVSHKHNCFLIAISCPKLERKGKIPAHAIACYVSSGDKWNNAFAKADVKGHVYFFDPNFGEYCVPKLEFASFLQSFLYQKYGATDGNLRGIDQWSL